MNYSHGQSNYSPIIYDYHFQVYPRMFGRFAWKVSFSLDAEGDQLRMAAGSAMSKTECFDAAKRYREKTLDELKEK